MKDKVFSASDYTKYRRQVANTKLSRSDVSNKVPTPERNSIVSLSPSVDTISQSNFVQFSRGFLRTEFFEFIYTLNIPGYTNALISAGLFVDRNTIYATAGTDVVKYNMDSGGVSKVTIPISGAISTFLQISGNYLYIGTGGAPGTTAYRIDKNTFTTLEVYQVIAGEQPRSITSDSNENIYIVTLSGKLYKNGSATVLNASNNFSNNVNFITYRAESGTEYLYVCQTGSHRVIKVDLAFPNDSSKNVNFAGNGVQNISGENVAATAGGVSNPRGISFDSAGNAYISTTGVNLATIRKVDVNGRISTFAGTGTTGYSGDGGPAKDARFNQPAQSQFTSDGSLYVKDNNNNVIRVIRPKDVSVVY